MNGDDDSFKLRVDKVFGSLSSSSSMWSLTDDEIEKKQWNRDLNRINDDEPLPSFSNASRFIPKRHHDDDDDDDEQPSSKHYHHDEDEFDVRSSIGLDSTLDYEEEEDEFDKVAVGKGKAADDCLFIRDVTDYALHHLPPTLGAHVPKDPRANHFAAKLRLKEDTDAAGNFHSLNLSDNDDLPLEDDAAIPKPILKKRETLMPPKSSKRVRFDPQFDDSNVVQDIHLASAKPPPNSCPNLPDYLKNPSNYTCYTLDSSSSSDMDDEANCRAYMDFINLIKKPTATTTDYTDAVDSSKPPTFISRKPPTVKSENECKQNQGVVPQFRSARISIAVGGDLDSEANAMEEDEQEEGGDKSVPKPGRRYRTRTMNHG